MANVHYLFLWLFIHKMLLSSLRLTLVRVTNNVDINHASMWPSILPGMLAVYLRDKEKAFQILGALRGYIQQYVAGQMLVGRLEYGVPRTWS
jgi:hypothetical protein